MVDRVPLPEMIDELRSEFVSRHMAYPLLVARGEMRAQTMELKIGRLAACHNTLAWLYRHADAIRDWMLFAAKVAPDDLKYEVVTDLTFDAPPDVLPAELEWEEPDAE
jgi:hypothetical protein